MKCKVSNLSIGNQNISKLKYQVLNEVMSFNKSSPCIVVNSLKSDFALLLGSVQCIITQSGSPLSHLAIVAREYNIPVFLLKKRILNNIPHNGILSLKNTTLTIHEE